MKERILLLLTSLFLSFCAHSQNTFQKTYGGDYLYASGSKVLELDDKGLLLIGWVDRHGAVRSRFQIIKTDNLGQMIWAKTYGGMQFDYGITGIETEDGYLLVGNTGYYTESGENLRDAYLIKIDKSGKVLWSKTYGGEKTESIISISKIESGFLLAGFTNSFGAGGMDVYLMKIDESGNLLWTETIGGARDEYLATLKPMRDGNFIIGGTTQSTPSERSDSFLIKINPKGDILWSKAFDSNYDNISEIAVTPDNEIVVSGYISDLSTGTNVPEIYLAKFDDAGNERWAKTYSISSYDNNGVVVDPEGNIYLGVNYNPDIYTRDILLLIKTDKYGEVLSPSVTFGSSRIEYFEDIRFSSDGSLLVLASTSRGDSPKFSKSSFYLNKVNLSLEGICESEPINIQSNNIAFKEVEFNYTISSGGSLLQEPQTSIVIETIVEATICSQETHSSLNELIRLYPNPTKASLFIELDDSVYQNIDITLISSTGALIKSFTTPILNDNKFEINTSSLSAGIYFVKISTNIGVLTKKVVIQ